MKNIIKLLALLPLFTACDDLFDPAIENVRDLSSMPDDPVYSHGVMSNAYVLLQDCYRSAPLSDVATDDAVSNDNSNAWRSMATGSWTAQNDPGERSQWKVCYNAIQYLNLFLENMDGVEWARDEVVQQLFKDRLQGEAYGLRAVHMWFLLRAHGGWSADGQLLGVPIKTASETPESDFTQPRDTYQDCVDQILEDCQKAIELLPLDYKDHTIGEIPQKYLDIMTNIAEDDAKVSTYDRVNGTGATGRISARIAEAVRAQVTLLAASPAFSKGTTVTWEDAANYAATVLDRIGGVSGMDADGYTWFANTTEITNLANGAVPAEVIWRSNMETNLTLETDNFPPTLYGNGRINPTQNLVDAFPMANGYPITDAANSGYDPNNPYADRDPRLAAYIVFDGSMQGTPDTQITTGSYGTSTDALNRESGKSTRTGYYLRKLLRKDCNPNPQYNTSQKHYTARIRYTEIFLAYAEAANEAWGPQGKGSHSYSAYDVIKAIRSRAGVGADNGDAYLESIKNDKDKMRELIRNERRLELCFENVRFYDLRRWKADLTETARGVNITKEQDGSLKYTTIDVENRDYQPYMNYGPIPYSEVLNFGFVQNQGW